MAPIDAEHRSSDSAPCGDLLHGKRVLVVDDERLVLSVVARMLRRCGAETFTASTAGEAERILSSNAGPFDLVIIDLVLPDRPGHDLAAALEHSQPGAAIVLMSGWATADRPGRPTVAPMLTKPFTAERLYEALDSALSARSRSA